MKYKLVISILVGFIVIAHTGRLSANEPEQKFQGFNLQGYDDKGNLIDESKRMTYVGGVDLTLMWEPVAQAHYHSFVWRTESRTCKRQSSRRAVGLVAEADAYQSVGKGTIRGLRTGRRPPSRPDGPIPPAFPPRVSLTHSAWGSCPILVLFLSYLGFNLALSRHTSSHVGRVADSG